MADKKISALTASTTPLAGTEVLPIVQSGATVKVAVSDLTAGRAVSATQLTLSTGNLVVGTAGKGIDFSANTHAAGMTSELLTWYEEGAWTPTFTGWTIAPSSIAGARYTRVGRQVTLNLLALDGVIVGGVSVIAGIPFTSSSVNGAVAVLKDVSGSTVSSFATVANNATQIASMTSATFTGLYWALSVTYIV